MKTTVILESKDEFWARTLEMARKVDRGEPLEPENSISVESLADLQALLTEERIRLVQAARRNRHSLTSLAGELGRDRKSVVRDVNELRRLGVVRLRREPNPGHGMRQIVEPTSKTLTLQIAI